jgi:CHAD domain-containing protein
MTTLTAETRDKLAQALDRAEVAVAQWPLAELGFAKIAGELAASYRRARKAIPSSWPRADAAELHELRKRVIVHRYQMELVTPLWPRSGKLWTGEAQRLRDRLGHHHDLVLLSELTAPRRPLARWRAKLAPLIEARKAQHVAAARRIANRLFAEKPKAFRRRLEALWATSDQAA